MFISTDFLASKYGVHDAIANFFVEREPPTDNLYWKNKLLYLRPEPGYLFIPVMVDTLYKLGIDRNVLLSNEYIHLLEQIGHIAALEETKQISKEQVIEQCIDLTKEKAVNKYFYTALTDYIKGGNKNFIHEMLFPFSALHRGDIFLFSVTVLDFDDETAKKIVAYWFAIIGSFLMLDDAIDIEIDKKTGDENAFLQSGLDKEGIERIKNILGQNLTTIKTFNNPLARAIDNQFVKMATQPHIQQYLNY
ncbi:MAG: hypothetical protein KF781_02970 [Chitinophagaceae bacterium]|nr:hypothetical protein [Chitinophagaceae bacterium]MCW5904473.1 hypothetical protein [Chitinophagaceae bacterium]